MRQVTTPESVDAQEPQSHETIQYRKSFDPDEFMPLHDEMKKRIANVRDEDLVAIVGLTGAGKSTTVDYLLNDEMEAVENGLTTCYQVKSSKRAKTAEIGHKGSQTLFPETHRVDEKALTLLDTAGLSDTRGANVSLCVSMALKHISKVAKVKGLVVVLRQSAITEPRAQGMRELFKLVGDLTSELYSGTVAFCITGITVAEEEMQDDDIKRFLIGKVTEMGKSISQAVKESDTQAQKEIEQTMRAIGYMNESNIFLMRHLDDKARQDRVRNDFFDYAKRMPGLRHGLKLAVDDSTWMRLLDWSQEQAHPALDQLTQWKESASIIKDAQKKTGLLTPLRRQLTETLERLVALNAAVQSVEEEKLQNDLGMSAATKQAGNDIELEGDCSHFQVPLPKRGANVSGLIAFEQRVSYDQPFQRISSAPYARVDTQNSSEGWADVSLNYMANPQESEAFLPLGVCAFGKVSDSAQHKELLQSTKSHGQEILTRLRQVQQKRKALDQEIGELRLQLTNSIRSLGLDLSVPEDDVRLGSTVTEIDMILRECATKLESQAKRRSEIEPFLERYQSLYEIALEAEITKPNVVEFIRLYREYLTITGVDSRAVDSCALTPLSVAGLQSPRLFSAPLKHSPAAVGDESAAQFGL